VLLSREQLVQLLSDHGVHAFDKDSLKKVKIRKRHSDSPLGMENCIVEA
jgi:hypothetical protein